LAYRKAYGDENVLKKADAWGGSLGQQAETLAKRIADKTTQRALLPVLTAAAGGTAEAGSDEYVVELATYLTDPQILGSSLVDTRVTIPLEEIVLQLRDDKSLREAVAAWLSETPLEADPASLPLRALVSRLVVSDVVKDSDQIAATLDAIDRWVQAHPADTPEASATDETRDPPGDDAEEMKVSDEKSPPRNLPDELLLGIVVRHRSDPPRSEHIVSMTERVIAIAEANGSQALVTSLRCQLAKHVAARDPDRARTILTETLDAILPRQNGATK
jgi:hypothetical protein